MIQIAEKFEILDLIEAMKPLQEQIQTLENYNRFSELEILISLEDLLTSIDENNFDEESPIIYSIFLYIEEELFTRILYCYSLLYPSKYPIYMLLAELISNKYRSLNFYVDFQEEVKKSSAFSDPYYIQGYRRKIKHINKDLLDIIKRDDVDTLQKLSCITLFQFTEEDEKLDIANKFRNIKISSQCNAIECAAFYSSLKCFKFLLLNIKLESFDLAKYAIAGGNTEIIHVCEQQKYSFKDTLKIAIDYHQNDIAEWIVDNNKDTIREDIYKACITAYNFDMLQFFLNRKSESTLNNSKLLVKYVLYCKQNYNIVVSSNSFVDYFMKFKCLKFSDEFGLIYCPNEKVELLDMFLNEDRNYHNLFDSPVNVTAYFGDLEMCKFLYSQLKSKTLVKPNYYDDEYCNYGEDYNYYVKRNDLVGSNILQSKVEIDIRVKTILINFV